jgi:thymidylate synthase (FAD)
MNLIKPSFEIIEQAPGIHGVKKQIELAGRTCYKSEDKITDTSCEEFVSRMVNSGHGAMLEHGTVYLRLPHSVLYQIGELTEKYYRNPYSKCRNVLEQFDVDSVYCESVCYVTTNYRVLVENGWLDDLQYLCEPTEHHEKRVTVKFICDRGVSHEFVRHRVFSFAQESTRYCNYSKKDKFNEEITFIKPIWLEESTMSPSDWESRKMIESNFDEEGVWYEECYKYEGDPRIKNSSWQWNSADWFYHQLKSSETTYLQLLKQGWKPQEARAILPNSLKTELVMTGFVSDWKHFFKLRCHSTAHPQARELAIPLKEEFIRKGFING